MFKMHFDIITIFPEAFVSYLNSSILKRAREKRLISIAIHNPRDFTNDKHKTVDEKSYGGGPGMVLKIEPIVRSLLFALQKKRSLKSYSNKKEVLVIFFSAKGKQFDAKMAAGLTEKYRRIIMIAGRYEGVDERIKRVIRDIGFRIEEISIGPYVLTGGELPALIVIDTVSRHIPGVLGKAESLEERRYGVGVPVYTRPEVFTVRGKRYSVPKVLLSGDHAKIIAWRIRHKKDF